MALLEQINRLNVAQRVWIVATVLWIGMTAYFLIQEFPTEERIRSRDLDGGSQALIEWGKERETESHKCSVEFPTTLPNYESRRLICTLEAGKRINARLAEAKKLSATIRREELAELAQSQFLAVAKILGLAIVPPLLLYGVVWWIAKGANRTQKS